ncbi:hypothetical protein T4B_719 [Trichinella pseudospiralis]|uniref:Uncharacterized protein n=1 Tax=Trichinella pseudospiralis TaxID=6337 RepID=A0A0V1IBN8_TRIPS|nr:hypothetical protein T4B_719 [Trichinella pseudospiralis]
MLKHAVLTDSQQSRRVDRNSSALLTLHSDHKMVLVSNYYQLDSRPLVQLQPRRLLFDTTLVPLRRSLYRIDLSDPRRSIGQEGQSTDLCLQANPHTIRFARSCY